MSFVQYYIYIYIHIINSIFSEKKNKKYTHPSNRRIWLLQIENIKL